MLGLFRFPFFVLQQIPVGTAQFGQADSSKTKAHTEALMTQLGSAPHQAQSLIMFGLLRFPFLVSTDASRYRPIRTGRFIQDGNPQRSLNDATRTRRRIKRNR